MKAITIFSFLILTGLSAFGQTVEQLPDSVLKKSVIKMEFFSPLSGNTTIGYERYLKNFTSIEAKVGIIGLGKKVNSYRNTGVFIKAGPKFKLKPSYASPGTFGTHLLRGSYIRPEIAISVFDEDRFGETSEVLTSVAVLINYGKQHVLGNIMTLDWYIGLGYGFSSDDDQGYYFGYSAGDSSFPMAINAGFTLGVLLK